MFKQIFRLTFIAFIWKQYKRTIISTLCLLLFLWLINFAHQEYLSFAEYQAESAYIGLSFIIKWVLLLLAVLLYVSFFLYSPTSKQVSSTQNKSVEGSMDDDPFAQIREKKNLRSRAEIMLEKHTQDSKDK